MNKPKKVPEARTVVVKDEWGVTRVVGGHGGEVGPLPTKPPEPPRRKKPGRRPDL